MLTKCTFPTVAAHGLLKQRPTCEGRKINDAGEVENQKVRFRGGWCRLAKRKHD